MSAVNRNFISFKYTETEDKKNHNIHLWRIHKHMIDKHNEIIINGDFRVLIDFPLRLPKLLIFRPDEDYEDDCEFDLISAFPRANGFTRGEILNILSRTYKNIYKEEKLTATKDLHELSKIPYKKFETNGIHGIYDYLITDLKINGMIYNDKYDYWKLFVSG
jgi:hypothetical protein